MPFVVYLDIQEEGGAPLGDRPGKNGNDTYSVQTKAHKGILCAAGSYLCDSEASPPPPFIKFPVLAYRRAS